MADEGRGPQVTKDDAAPITEEFQHLLERGDALCEKGRYRSAIELWRQALDALPGGEMPPAFEKTLHARIARAYFDRSQLSLGERATEKVLRRGLGRLEEALQWDPNNAHYLFEAGRTHWRLGEHARARELLEEAAKAPGATPLMRYYAAVAQLHAGEPQAALEGLSQRPSFDSESSSTLALDWIRTEAYATAAAGDPARAVSLLTEAGLPVQRVMQDVESLLRAAEPSGELCAAASAFYRRLESQPQDSRARLASLLGDLHAACNDIDSAITWWRQAHQLSPGEEVIQRLEWACERRVAEAIEAGNVDEGVHWCKVALEMSPNHPTLKQMKQSLRLLTAYAHWEKGEMDEALAVWHETATAEHSVDAAWNTAVAQELAQDHSRAVDAWINVATLAQESNEPRLVQHAAFRAGCLALRGGDVERAHSLWQKAASVESDDSKAHRLLALLALSGEPNSSAVNTLEQAHAKFPTDPIIAVALAAVHDQSDASLQSKIERWQTALSLSQEKAWIWDAWRKRTLELGLQAWQNGALDQAMSIFSKILLEDRFDPDGWIWCGTIHLQLGNEELATVCFDNAISTDPNDAGIYVKIGGCYLMSGREDEAHAFFAKAKEADPSPATNLRIAEVCVEIGRGDWAYNHLSEAIRHCESHSPELYRIIQLLQDVGEGHDLRPQLEAIAKVIDRPHRVEFLIGVEQIWASQWNEALATLERVRQAAHPHNDEALQEDVRHAEKTMILLLTTGQVDPEASRERLRKATKRWVDEGMTDDVDTPLTHARTRAEEHLAKAVEEHLSTPPKVREAHHDASQPTAGVALVQFGKGLDLKRLIPMTIPSVAPEPLPS